MKEIILTEGYTALVDDEDWPWCARFTWRVDKRSKNALIYAIRHVCLNGRKKTTQRLHRYILGIDDPSVQIDHKDHNGLNCQRSNLRICTHAQNCQNKRKAEGTSSQFKGVCEAAGRWQAKIRIDGQPVHLGVFDSEQEAALAYDAVAQEHFGEFACLNFPSTDSVQSPATDTERR